MLRFNRIILIATSCSEATEAMTHNRVHEIGKLASEGQYKFGEEHSQEGKYTGRTKVARGVLDIENALSADFRE